METKQAIADNEALDIIERVILDNEVTYSELLRRYGSNADMKRAIRSHGYHIKELIRSRRRVMGAVQVRS